MEAIIARPTTGAKRSPAPKEPASPEMRPKQQSAPQPAIHRQEKFGDALNHIPVHQAGRTGELLALQCTWDIEAIADEVVKLGNSIDDYSLGALEGLLRCYGLRIQELTGQLMAYLSQDGTTAGDMHWKVFRESRPFRGDEA